MRDIREESNRQASKATRDFNPKGYSSRKKSCNEMINLTETKYFTTVGRIDNTITESH